MIVNNAAYYNYLSTTLRPSNDLDANNGNKPNGNTGNSGSVDNNTTNTGSTGNTGGTGNVDKKPETKPAPAPETKPTSDKDMDNVDIKGPDHIDEDENKVEDGGREWLYNTTDDGYLPDFKLGDWENTSEILFGDNVMKDGNNMYSVFLPEALQAKMKEDPEFAKEIQSKLDDFFKSASKESGTLEDGTEYHVVAQQMAVAMDENGNIIHTYVRTESYSVAGELPEAANDENALDVDEEVNNNLIEKYGFSMYQSTLQIGADDDKKALTAEEKNIKAMMEIGVQSVITMETAQVDNQEPVTKIRKANGDVVELETGKLIQKHAGYMDSSIKYDAKA